MSMLEMHRTNPGVDRGLGAQYFEQLCPFDVFNHRPFQISFHLNDSKKKALLISHFTDVRDPIVLSQAVTCFSTLDSLRNVWPRSPQNLLFFMPQHHLVYMLSYCFENLAKLSGPSSVHSSRGGGGGIKRAGLRVRAHDTDIRTLRADNSRGLFFRPIHSEVVGGRSKFFKVFLPLMFWELSVTSTYTSVLLNVIFPLAE